MELTFAKCKEIADTLPIGLYTGRRIPIEVDAKETKSFYSTMEDKIVISYPVINERLKNMKEGSCNEEEAVRSMLYHEVSHAILTPQDLRATTPVNIFEDERIESILRHYYHGTDFRKQLYDIHGGHAPRAYNAETAFFNAVRFGLGTGKVQTEINRIKKEYASLNRASTYYGSGDDIGWLRYVRDINNLYDMIERDFRSNPDAYNQEGGEGEKKDMDKTASGQGDKDGKSKDKQKASESEQGDGEPTEMDSDTPSMSDDDMPEMSREEVHRMVGKALGKQPNLSDAEVQRLNEFQKTVETIIGNFNKKNHGGSGVNAYSGVFNPRNVARKDYRYFDRAMTTQGNNKFGTCHLNLIIDCSGSFESNVPLTNGILAVLTEIERKNRNFSMDVAFINHEWHICENVRERRMKAWGGNDIPDNMKEILLKMQKQQTCNYNIILFDGDAICEYRSSPIEDKRRFGAFDMKQTTLITDPDNVQYMDPPFSSTKVVVTQDYTAELIKHITNALTIAFG